VCVRLHVHRHMHACIIRHFNLWNEWMCCKKVKFPWTLFRSPVSFSFAYVSSLSYLELFAGLGLGILTGRSLHLA
jgi:hypothetical protein